MPIEKTTVSPEEIETIAHLNKLLRHDEVRQGSLLRKTSMQDFELADRHVGCDACVKRRSLGRKCYNLILDNEGATLVFGRPLKDQRGCVILRYHRNHRFVRSLARRVNDDYSCRKGQDVSDLAPVEVS